MKAICGKVIVRVSVGLAIAWMLLGITVSAKTRAEREENNRYYVCQEQALIGRVREYLKIKGYRNSGVTVSRTIFQDGETQYRVTVHHGAINKLLVEERDSLLEELSNITFEDEGASFVYEFLQ